MLADNLAFTDEHNEGAECDKIIKRRGHDSGYKVIKNLENYPLCLRNTIGGIISSVIRSQSCPNDCNFIHFFSYKI